MSATALPATLSDVESARLPATYEAAQRAIAECHRVDECKNWADKAAALASYARQARDDSLRVMALRIQARAERRCGELLKQIEPARGANQNIQEGAHPKVTRSSAAQEAGLSEHQRKTALRIASIPQEDFNNRVEGPSPPTITALAAAGTVSTATGRKGDGTPSAAEACRALLGFAEFCSATDPEAVAQRLDNHEALSLRSCVALIDQWLDRFVSHVPADLNDRPVG
jgi:hypothetical protein